MEIVLGALITGVFAVLVARINSSVKKVHAQVQTNHGLRPGEYLEMLPSVLQGQVHSAQLLTEHTNQDADNFAEISKRLTSIERAVNV